MGQEALGGVRLVFAYEAEAKLLAARKLKFDAMAKANMRFVKDRR